MLAPAALATTRRSAFLGGFARGLAAGGIALFVLLAWLWVDRDSTVDALNAQLAHVTVPVTTAKTPGPVRAAASPPIAKPVTPQRIAVTPAPTGPLKPAPIAGLIETTATGDLPRVDAKTGVTPFKAYRRPFTAPVGKPLVSLIVTDLGLSKAAFQSALAQLPPDVSFGISPYAGQGGALINAARSSGHEAWLVLPMQPASYPRADPGPKTLLNGATASFNLARLNDLMKTGAGYAGFVGSFDPVFLASPADALPVVTALWQRGLGLADTSRQAMAGVDPTKPYIHVDLWIDRTVNAASLADSLKLLEALAQRNGHASAVLQPLPLSYPMLRQWADSLPARGFALGPLSAQAHP